MASANDAEEADGPFAETHRTLLSDSNLQFQFEVPKPNEPPSWLEPLAELIRALAPFLYYVFWAGVAVVVAMILWAIVTELARRLPQGGEEKPADAPPPVPAFRPSETRARALLEEADRLAREGRYGEAVRVLLHRSIDDMDAAHPATIAPSMTSREISTLQYLSDEGRATFVKIARAVEVSLFAGRPLGADEFADCRRAYATFAFASPAA